jgi:hypothetical protein
MLHSTEAENGTSVHQEKREYPNPGVVHDMSVFAALPIQKHGRFQAARRQSPDYQSRRLLPALSG